MGECWQLEQMGGVWIEMGFKAARCWVPSLSLTNSNVVDWEIIPEDSERRDYCCTCTRIIFKKIYNKTEKCNLEDFWTPLFLVYGFGALYSLSHIIAGQQCSNRDVCVALKLRPDWDVAVGFRIFVELSSN